MCGARLPERWQTKREFSRKLKAGTCFLDEIGGISTNMQARLLRVLQEHEIRRVGGKDWVKVDVRVVAATNHNLSEAVSKGDFRQDLYYRLDVVTIHLPPLRERVGDIPLLGVLFSPALHPGERQIHNGHLR